MENTHTDEPMRSPTTAALAAAVSAFQGEVENAKKSAANPHFKSKYADLAEIWDTIRGPLSTAGLAVMQFPTDSPPGTVALRTELHHKSGEWIAGILTMPLAQNTPQGCGSAITYARRYALAAVLGIAQEDDDGHAASQRSVPAQQSRPAPAKPATPNGKSAEAPKPAAPKLDARPVTEAQLKRLYALAGEKEIGGPIVKTYLALKYGIESSKELNRTQYEEVCALLEKGAGAVVEVIEEIEDKQSAVVTIEAEALPIPDTNTMPWDDEPVVL